MPSTSQGFLIGSHHCIWTPQLQLYIWVCFNVFFLKKCKIIKKKTIIDIGYLGWMDALVLEQHVCIWAKLLKFWKKKTRFDASDVSAYADEKQLNDSYICILTSCENAALATSVCGQRYIYKITKLKQEWSFFYGSQLPLVGVCFGWDTLVQIAPVSSDLTKASSSIYASLVEEVVRGDGWQEKLRQWWSGVRLAG